MNSRLKLLTATACLGLALSTSSAIASYHNEGNSSGVSGKQASKLKHHEKFVFTIGVDTATLERTSNKTYVLTIPKNQNIHIFAMSGPPDRDSFKLSLKEYNKMVYTGPNNFKINPPNLVLSAGNNSSIYELSSTKETKTHLIYHLLLLGKQGPENYTGKVTLYIDDMTGLLSSNLPL